jgi:membrane associated rhomboid family serine protease
VIKQVNRLSYIVLSLLALVLAVFVLWRGGLTGVDAALLGAFAVLLGLLGYFLRYRQTPVQSLEHLAELVREKPVLLEFYSDY